MNAFLVLIWIPLVLCTGMNTQEVVKNLLLIEQGSYLPKVGYI